MSDETLVTTGEPTAAAGQPSTEPTVTTTTEPTPQTGATPGAADPDRVEQAFAKRLSAERQKIEQQYTPYRSLIESEAKRYNMTPEQYVQAVQQQREEEERQQYRDKGIDPDTVNQLIEKHPEVQRAKEMRAKQEEETRFKAEADEFFQTFPDVKPTDIPPEVWRLKEEKKLSLTDAYLRHTFPNMKQSLEKAKDEGVKEYLAKKRNAPGVTEGAGATPVTESKAPKTFAEAKAGALAMLKQSMKT